MGSGAIKKFTMRKPKQLNSRLHIVFLERKVITLLFYAFANKRIGNNF